MLTLVIVIDGNRKTLSVENSCTIGHIYDQVHKMANLADMQTLYLAFEGKQLEYNANQTVNTYGIGNMSTITVAIRVHGGSFSDIPGYVSRTNTESCCITFDNDPEEYRAKMSCGHVFCVEAMKNYVNVTLNDGLYRFHCTQCRHEWAYDHVRHVACFSEEERTEKGAQLNANFLKYGKAMQQCPICHNYCMRDLQTWVGPINFVDCPVCTSRRGKKTSFCWSCKREWRGGFGKLCGNQGCDGGDSRVRELSKCDTKEISSTSGCPTMRGCERCGALIVHQDRCKHVRCPTCSYDFCFVCLKTPKNDAWPCGGANSACPGGVAPRQTSLPG